MSRKNRESYCSMSNQQFLDPATGNFKRLDSTAWYIKDRNKKPCFFINMHTKFQQMPKACFELTTERTPGVDVAAIKKDVAEFMEKNYEH
jgi:hypothetical protein